MEQTNIPQSNFSIGNIILLESKFERAIVFSKIDEQNVNTDIAIDVNHTDITKDTFAVFIGYKMKITHNDDFIFDVLIKYSAEFRANGNLTEKQKLDFANINAPAMIYPFVRERISSLTTKAGVGNVLIPPVNFVQMYENKKSKMPH